jgi:hypothetical protein
MISEEDVGAVDIGRRDLVSHDAGEAKKNIQRK